MRLWEFMREDATANSFADNLKRQADAKADQAKKLKQAASVQKKREQVNSARASLMKKQGELSKIAAVCAKHKKTYISLCLLLTA
ncbi:hypothetical protein H261_21064 [Paramagnetospirillum caucaseum]|uniref:Uncharacterized protein n=2 Tax=Paramagnetospirillum caucaseum TaxID=1244869 RepID=M3A510_9PROT|nr:hypothetical protein H261_21064 [Paramagnetospirillum caucaseum]